MSNKTPFTRRTFLATSAAAGAGVVLAGPLVAEAARSIPTVKLGKTGQTVTTLGFGSSLEVTPRLLNTSLMQGITFIDTAEGYGSGNSERNIGEILEKNGRRKD
ncbi:MAG: aldo/keto reductase, partial [bacterium]|nr:aldo/keto reductase [bacterium]